MSNNKITEQLSDSRVEGFFAEGGDLGRRTIVMAGTNEDQVEACSAASDAPKGVISTEGYENGPVAVIVEGPVEVEAGGAATPGHRAILGSTGQKVVSMENSPNLTDDEVNILGDFESTATDDGDIVIVNVKPRREKNPYKTRQLIFPIPTLSATAAQLLIRMPEAGVITAVRSAVTTGITADDTNYWTEQITNVTQSVAILETAGDVNTTKATGGAGYTADTYRSFTLEEVANLDFAAGDVFRYNATKAASASNQVGKSLIIEYKK